MKKLFIFFATILVGLFLVACEPGSDNDVFTYEVTFDLNGSIDTVEPQTIWENRTVTKPRDPSIEDGEFLYWANKETLSEWDFSLNRVNEDLTLIAMWKDIHLVVFDLNYDNLILQEVNILSDSKLDIPEQPLRANYNFLGWFLNEELFNFEQGIMSNLILVAKWEVIQYNVTFNSNGGSDVSNIVLNGDELFNEPLQPIKSGSNFIGWFSDEALTIKYQFGVVIDRDLTLYAKWEVVKFTITFNSNGGSNVLDIVLNSDELVTQPLQPNKEGNKFIGWFSDEALTTEYQFGVVTDKDLTLYAKWEVMEYTITFESNGGDVISNYGLLFNSVITLPTPIKQGFKFIEWQLDGLAFALTNMPANDLTLIALWEQEVSYNVSFALGYDNLTLETLEVLEGQLAIKPEEPTRIGYTFVEWQLNGIKFDFEVAITSEVDLIAKWEVNEYIVTFNSNGGTLIADELIEYNKVVSRPVDPTRENYLFVEWQLDGIAFDFNTLITHALTLNALWEDDLVQLDLEELITNWNNKSFDMNSEVLLPSIGSNNTVLLWDVDEFVTNSFWNDVTVDTNILVKLTVTLDDISVDANINFTIKFIETIVSYGKELVLQSDFGLTNGWSAYGSRDNQAIANGILDPNPSGETAWNLMGGNVNNSGWDHIRMGGKEASTKEGAQVFLATNFTFDKIITEIIINVVGLDSASGNEVIWLQSSIDNQNWTDVTSKEVEEIGDLIFNDIKVDANNYFRFVIIRQSSGSDNRGTDIKAITFYEELDPVSADLNEIEFLSTNLLEAIKLTLIDLGVNGSQITWSSSNEDIITNTGDVIIPEITTNVTLTATAVNGSITFEKEFIFTVVGVKTRLVELLDLIVLPNETDINLVLPTTTNNGLVITWSSSNELVINSSTGVVAVTPNAEISVTLTAAITEGSYTITKEFDVMVKEITVVEEETYVLSTAATGYPTSYKNYTWDFAGIVFTGIQLTKNGNAIQGNSSRSPNSNITSNDLGLITEINILINTGNQIAGANSKFYVMVSNNSDFTNSIKYGFGKDYTDNTNITISDGTVTNVLTKKASLITIDVSGDNASFVRFYWESGASYFTEIKVTATK